MGSSRILCNYLLKNSRNFNRGLRTLAHNNELKVADVEPPPPLPITKHTKVGIIEYVSSQPIIEANFKERFSDFHVSEIDDKGHIVELTELNLPKEDPPTTEFYTHCVLHKEGIDSEHVSRILAKELNISRHAIRMAGTKDKNATTNQRISIENVDALRISSIESKRFFLGNFKYSSQPITSGDLNGNHFEIVLKNIQQIQDSSSPTLHFERGLKNLQDFGFINYYGLQRFGSSTVPNFVVGRAALRMDWQQALDLALGPPKPTDPPMIFQAKRFWYATRDPIKLFKKFPKIHNQRTIENVIFVALRYNYDKGNGDLLQIYKTIPRTTRFLYMTAFQALLWNHMATFRLQHFGFKPIPGDLVRGDGKSAGDFIADDATSVKVLTEDDLDKYSIYDILLMTPGKEVPFYSHDVLQNHHLQLLQSHGLEPNCIEVFEPLNEAPATIYRPLVVRPKNVKYSIMPFGTEEKDDGFVDYDLVSNKYDFLKSEEVKESADEHLRVYSQAELILKLKDMAKEKICAKVEFSLPKSCYATMALREVVNLPQGKDWIDYDDLSWTHPSDETPDQDVVT